MEVTNLLQVTLREVENLLPNSRNINWPSAFMPHHTIQTIFRTYSNKTKQKIEELVKGRTQGKIKHSEQKQ